MVYKLGTTLRIIAIAVLHNIGIQANNMIDFDKEDVDQPNIPAFPPNIEGAKIRNVFIQQHFHEYETKS